MREYVLLKTLKGSETWKAGTVFTDETLPEDLKTEVDDPQLINVRIRHDPAEIQRFLDAEVEQVDDDVPEPAPGSVRSTGSMLQR